MWRDFKRICKSGFFNFWRNSFVSLANLLVMTVALFVIGSLMFNNALLDGSLQELRDKVDINVYFTLDALEGDILALASALEVLPEVEEVEYKSREEVLEDFEIRHVGDAHHLQALSELDENPLGAIVNIRAKETSQYEGIAEFLEEEEILSAQRTPIIDKVNYHQNKKVIDRLTDIIDSTERTSLLQTFVLVIIAIMVTFNTIRLAIHISREEISVMRLVGASRFYVQGPFIITGSITGIFSAIITLILFYPLTRSFALLFYPFPVFFGEGFAEASLSTYYVENFGQIFVVILVAGILIGSLSSYLAVKKYLKR
jgi:cell division transport system permease protein